MARGGNPASSFSMRLVCTLSCVLTLTLWRQGEEDIAKGLHFLRTHIQDLEKETTQMTVGFEIIFPSMLNEARSLKLDIPYDLSCIMHIIKLREKKLNRIPKEKMHTVPSPLLKSLEALQEIVQWDRMLKLQSTNGSFLCSPSSTAAAYLNTHDEKCLEYLTYVMRRFEDNVPFVYPLEILERAWVVDTIQRLGIDHHFKEEISNTLDYLYRSFRKHGIGWARHVSISDLDDTCMALRLLRLHGYPISPDVLEYFKDDDESFVCFMGETHKGVSDFFCLYRFSQIAFPGEKILKQAKSFAEQHLMNSIKSNLVHDKWALKKSLHKEVEWGLRNPWKVCLPRLEAREYIENYGENDLWIGKCLYRMYNVNNGKYLELAKLDYDKLQDMHKKEAKSIIQWWNSCGFDEPLVTQENPQEIHFSIAAALYEPEFSVFRAAYTKSNCIENILKDIFLSYDSIDDLKLFQQAVDQWKPSLLHDVPITLKRAFMGIYDNMNDLAKQASNIQGKDVFPYIHELRKKQVQEYLNIRETKDAKQFTILEEYVEEAKREIAVPIRLLPCMFLMGEVLSDIALKCLDHQSKILENLTLYLALLNTVIKERTAVHLFMKEHNFSKQEAISDIKEKIDDVFAELAHECLKPSCHAPRACRRLIFEHGRIARFNLNKISNEQV